MKYNNFNKIGDTCFRFANQVDCMYGFAKWLVKTKNPDDKSFKEWINRNPISEKQKTYHYGGNKKSKEFNRFKMILRHVIEIYKLVKINQDKYEWVYKPENYSDIINKIASINTTMKENSKNTCLAFKAMLDFMIQYPKLNDAKKIFYAFSVYEVNDNFFQIYTYDFDQLMEILVEKKYKKLNNVEELIQKCFLSEKKSKNLENFCNLLLNNKDNFEIDEEDFINLRKNKWIEFENSFYFNQYIRKNSYETISKYFLKNQIKKLLNNEYFDLFNRVMCGLGLSEKSGKKVEEYLNSKLKILNGKYFVQETNKPNSYPYSHEDTNLYLKNIQQKNFKSIKKDPHLCGQETPTIVEYFVNLKFCYLFNIAPQDCKNFVNTILDEKYYPNIFAPGRKSDMIYHSNGKLYSIETTYLQNDHSIIKEEHFSCINHIATYEPKQEYAYLFLIQICKNNEKIKDWFVAKEPDNYKGKYEFKAITFEQLSNVVRIEEIIGNSC